jgi:hypothetical protein
MFLENESFQNYQEGEACSLCVDYKPDIRQGIDSHLLLNVSPP